MCERWKMGSSLEGSGSFTRTSFSNTGCKECIGRYSPRENILHQDVCVCVYVWVRVLPACISWAARCSCCWTAYRAQTRRTALPRELRAGNRWRGTPRVPCCFWPCKSEKKHGTYLEVFQQQINTKSGLTVTNDAAVKSSLSSETVSLTAMCFWLCWVSVLFWTNAIKGHMLYSFQISEGGTNTWPGCCFNTNTKVSIWDLQFHKSDRFLISILIVSEMKTCSDAAIDRHAADLLTLPLCRSFLGPKQWVRESKTRFCSKSLTWMLARKILLILT